MGEEDKIKRKTHRLERRQKKKLIGEGVKERETETRKDSYSKKRETLRKLYDGKKGEKDGIERQIKIQRKRELR